MTKQRTYEIEVIDGQPTLATSRTVTEQQGSWKWQKRLCQAFYIAVYSSRIKAWLWKSTGHSMSFSGGNIRGGNYSSGEGSVHNRKLNPVELCALATVRGEN